MVKSLFIAFRHPCRSCIHIHASITCIQPHSCIHICAFMNLHHSRIYIQASITSSGEGSWNACGLLKYGPHLGHTKKLEHANPNDQSQFGPQFGHSSKPEHIKFSYMHKFAPDICLHLLHLWLTRAAQPPPSATPSPPEAACRPYKG